MIASLRGVVLLIADDHCVLDVHGVGYCVYASTRTLSQLRDTQGEVRLNIETIVREDAILLYGFYDSSEQVWFRLLRVVQGVGTRMAMAILSVLTPQELIETLRASDKKNLMRVSGVGARLAGRIVTELHDRVSNLTSLEESAQLPNVGESTKNTQSQLEGDALLALEGLGFRRVEAFPVIRNILKESADDLTLDKLIQKSLKALAR